jgi:hypothetical protein
MGGLYLPHLRERRVSLSISNGASFGLAALGGSVVTIAIGHTAPLRGLVIVGCIALAVLTDWTINSVVVGIASAVRGGYSLWECVRTQLVSDADVLFLVFVAAALSALGADRSLGLQALGVCIALAAFEVRLMTRGELDGALERRSVGAHTASIVAVTALFAYMSPTLAAFALVAFGIFLVHATDRSMAVPMSVAIGLSLASAAVGHAVGLPLIATTALVVASAFAAIEAAVVGFRSAKAKPHVDIWTVVGLLIPGRWELTTICLVAIAAAVVAPLYQGGVESTTTLALVLFASVWLLHTRPSSPTFD